MDGLEIEVLGGTKTTELKFDNGSLTVRKSNTARISDAGEAASKRAELTFVGTFYEPTGGLKEERLLVETIEDEALTHARDALDGIETFFFDRGRFLGRGDQALVKIQEWLWVGFEVLEGRLGTVVEVRRHKVGSARFTSGSSDLVSTLITALR
jgi:hypothetical protein